MSFDVRDTNDTDTDTETDTTGDDIDDDAKTGTQRWSTKTCVLMQESSRDLFPANQTKDRLSWFSKYWTHLRWFKLLLVKVTSRVACQGHQVVPPPLLVVTGAPILPPSTPITLMFTRFNKAAQLKLLSTKKQKVKLPFCALNKIKNLWVVIPQSTRSLNCIYASVGFMSENQADRTCFPFECSS